jgi:ATP-dependent Zn protease
MLTRPLRTLLVIAIAAAVVFFIFERLTAPIESVRDLDYKTFINYLESNKIQTFDAVGLNVRGTLTDGENYSTQIPNRDTVLAREVVKHVRGTVRFESAPQYGLLYTFLSFMPFLFVVVVVLLILRGAQRRPPT